MPPPARLNLVFTYGSEKQKWIEALTREFNAAKHTSVTGKSLWVEAIPMGSGDCIQEILQGKRKTHLTSPASTAFIRLGNAESQARTGHGVVEDPVNLVLSPVVIAMWKPMAEALGWPAKSPGWREIHDLAVDSQGWAGKGFPQWGKFRFGHTHPDYSNSGLISILAEAYAATGKVRGLTLDDLALPATGEYISHLESAVVHYGESTGFFGRKMFDGGPGYLSAAVLYENMVIEAADRKDLAFPVVALYPREGTFWSDHPAAIVQREWVTPEIKAGAKTYLDFLTARPQQERAMQYGFRPADPAIPLAAPVDAGHGVNPAEPQTTLDVPEVPVIQATLNLWRERKKKSNVVLVLDVSGSMKSDSKIIYAKKGAQQFIQMLGDKDELSVLPFNDKVTWLAKSKPLAGERDAIKRSVDSLFVDGGTALYDAVVDGLAYLKANPRPDMINAMVVLSDGADTHSKTQLELLLKQLRQDDEAGGVRIFTISYGKDAKGDILEQISLATKARSFAGSTTDIDRVFREISTFF
ncbi:MAG TPA: VWA domain-containing protein [Verrucomicrobium sp.]|nr:VWA domain-containing protein [Verrucomicrobium sp.]